MVTPLADLGDIVAFVDPASGRAKSKITSSRSADVVVAQDDLGRIFVLHAYAGRLTTTAHTDRIFNLVTDFHPRVIGIDASAMQSLYADALMREAKQRVARLPLQPIKMPTAVDKFARTRSILQPVIAHGRLFVQATQRDLWQELEAFPGGLTVDLVDALAQAVALLRKISVKVADAHDRDAHLEYLRNTGAPDWYVAQVAKN